MIFEQSARRSFNSAANSVLGTKF